MGKEIEDIITDCLEHANQNGTNFSKKDVDEIVHAETFFDSNDVLKWSKTSADGGKGGTPVPEDHPEYEKLKTEAEIKRAKQKEKDHYDNVQEETRKMQILIKAQKTQQEFDKLNQDPAKVKAKQTIELANNVSGAFSKIAQSIPKGQDKKVYGKYPKLTDEELKQRINRINLEQSYSNLSGDTKTIKSGQDKAREALETIGSLLAVAGSAVGVYFLVKNKGKINS